MIKNYEPIFGILGLSDVGKFASVYIDRINRAHIYRSILPKFNFIDKKKKV
jgi:hypothetical protein